MVGGKGVLITMGFVISSFTRLHFPKHTHGDPLLQQRLEPFPFKKGMDYGLYRTRLFSQNRLNGRFTQNRQSSGDFTHANRTSGLFFWRLFIGVVSLSNPTSHDTKLMIVAVERYGMTYEAPEAARMIDSLA
jgi:hypothetical protein